MNPARSLTPDQVRAVRATYVKLQAALDRRQRLRAELREIRERRRHLRAELAAAQSEIAGLHLSHLARQYGVAHNVISRAALARHYKEIR